MAVLVLDRIQAEQGVTGSAAEPSPTGSEMWMGCHDMDLGVPGGWGIIQGGLKGVWDASLHRIAHWVTEELSAIRHEVIYLPHATEDPAAVTCGFGALAGHRAFSKAAIC